MYSLQSRKSAEGIQFRIKLSPKKHEKIEPKPPNRRTIINCPLQKKKKERRREENQGLEIMGEIKSRNRNIEKGKL